MISKNQLKTVTADELPHRSTTLHKDAIVDITLWLYKQLPIRVAKMIIDFQGLPFSLGCREPILTAHDKYIESFKKLAFFPEIDRFQKRMSKSKSQSKFSDLSEKDQQKLWANVLSYAETLDHLLDSHKDVLPLLIEGFSNIDLPDRYQFAQDFMNKIIADRMALRLLCNHLVDLVKAYEKTYGKMTPEQVSKNRQLLKKERFIGIFDKKFSPEELIRNIFEEQQDLCIGMFGPNVPELSLVIKSNLKTVHVSPKSKNINQYGNQRRKSLTGDDDQIAHTFNYIPHALEYILKEVIKNSLSAQIKSAIKKHGEYHAKNHDPIKVLIVLNDQDFIIRISDKGNGVPYTQVETIWNYHITTAGEGQDDSSFFDLAGQSGAGTDKALSGYGCGLPISKVYAELMGGNISMETIQGYGTEVFIRLPYLNNNNEGSARSHRNANDDAMKFYKKVRF